MMTLNSRNSLGTRLLASGLLCSLLLLATPVNAYVEDELDDGAGGVVTAFVDVWWECGDRCTAHSRHGSVVAVRGDLWTGSSGDDYCFTPDIEESNPMTCSNETGNIGSCDAATGRTTIDASNDYVDHPTVYNKFCP